MKHVRDSYRRPGPSWEGGRLTGLAAFALAAIVALSPGHASRADIIAAAAVSPWPAFSACVLARESGGDPTVRNATGHHGRWQFNNAAWQSSLPWMVRDRLVEVGMKPRAAKRIRIRLQALPIRRWPAVMQDIGHAAVIVAGIRDPSVRGWRHWRLADSPCNQLRGK